MFVSTVFVVGGGYCLFLLVGSAVFVFIDVFVGGGCVCC